ncbi:helix-turn-helix domain-containing protein [Kitasatospora sp. NBC_01266]|uniref:helix-turn-helix domain-containing protein n=1 Tax=Kitasatospora sp. NBC_01266 TaxID=2903572 RepID=UPI002E350F12|nr:helix-turn-helix domain-containing protein [Kitasatospora sp. NBC_01266]
MEQLVERLSALDPEAESAVRAIAYFDTLIASRAGLDSFVRAAAILTGCPAGLHDPDRHVYLRIHPDGHRLDPGPAAPAWPGADLHGTAHGRVWVERGGAPTTVDGVILERLAAGVGIVLDRTRGRAPAWDPAGVETLLSADADPATRLRAARRLTIPVELRVRVVAALPLRRSGADPVAAPEFGDPVLSRWSTRIGRVSAAIVPATTDCRELPLRTGVGPSCTVADAWRSWAGAVTALRLTADGTPAGPGPRHLCHDDLGALAVLTERLAPADALIADVRALLAAEAATAGSLATLSALVEQNSLRQAAAALHLHHSTLQARLPQLQAVLGYPLDTAAGRARLHLALALHRIHANGMLP